MSRPALRRSWRAAAAAAILAAGLPLMLTRAPAPAAASTVTPGAVTAGASTPVTGAGSTWSENALDLWRRTLARRGLTVNYTDDGSTDGRQEFIAGEVDFAVSEVPFQTHPADGSAPERPDRPYAYVPIVAGATTLMYHVSSGGKLLTGLRLSPGTIAKIFTGVITRWNDPQIAAENPALDLPDERITPVVRADSAGTTAQFTAWLADQQPTLWQAYCTRVHLSQPCGAVQTYPIVAGMRAQSGSTGVADYVAQDYGEGAITYVEDSYAKLVHLPVALVLNAAGYYTAPTPQATAVALLKAQINSDKGSPGYLTEQLDGVYNDADPRAYPISSYSYLIVPTTTADGFTTAKGASLARFASYALCAGQQDVDQLGYSALPVNLASAGLRQLARIPGAQVQQVAMADCHNPTFAADGANTLAVTAPAPPACDKLGAAQCVPPGTPARSPAKAAARPAGRQPQGAAPPPVRPQPRVIPGAGSWSGTQTIGVAGLAALAAVFLLPGAIIAVRRPRRGPRSRTAGE